MDELREVLHLYAERNSIRLCRRGKAIYLPDGTTYRLPCGNRWMCPQCSKQRLAEDRYAIAKVLQSKAAALFVTLTIADGEFDTLDQALGALVAIWSRAFTGSWMTRFGKRSGLLGWVRCVEVTFPEEAFHPHIHCVFLFEKRDEPHVAELVTRWLDVSSTFGCRAAVQGQRYRWVRRGKPREVVASYLTWQNAIRQSTAGKGRTPGDLLHAVANDGDADALKILLQFQNAVKGRQKISVSRGFWNL